MNDAALYVSEGASADVQGVLFANNLHDSNDGASGPFNLPPGTLDFAGVVRAADAGFVSPGSPDEDYHLLASSPAIDEAGASSLAVDLDGTPRPSGPAPDLGAYEFTP
jgi:hypothetical protein